MKLRVYFIVTSLRFFLFLSSPWIIPKREASGKGGSGGKKIWSQVTVHYLLSKNYSKDFIIPHREVKKNLSRHEWKFTRKVFTSFHEFDIREDHLRWNWMKNRYLVLAHSTIENQLEEQRVSIINHILKRFLRTNTRIKIYYLAVELFKIFMFEIGDLSTNILTLSFSCVSKKNWFSNCVDIKSLYLIKRVVRIYSFRIIRKYYY